MTVEEDAVNPSVQDTCDEFEVLQEKANRLDEIEARATAQFAEIKAEHLHSFARSCRLLICEHMEPAKLIVEVMGWPEPEWVKKK